MIPTIRDGRLHEARALAELHLRTALFAYAEIFPPEAPPPTLDELVETWSASLRKQSHRALVGVVDGEITGVVLAGPDPSDGSLGHLSRLYVEPLRWGQGFGRALHDACLARLRGRSFSAATLWVLERNEHVRTWYERLGWEPTGERKPVYGPAGIDDVRYRIPLLRTGTLIGTEEASHG